MMAHAMSQVAAAERLRRLEASGQLDKLKKCRGYWDGRPDKLFIERNQVGIGEHLHSRSNARSGPVSALFEVKSINDKPLETRVVRDIKGQINLGYKCTDV